MKYFFILLISLSFFSKASSAAEVHAFAALGQNYSGLGSARLGINSWEVGLLSNYSYGVSKILKTEKFYFGLGVAAIRNFSSPGFYTGTGFIYPVYLGGSIRGELYAVTSINGFSEGSGLLGVQWDF